MAITSVEATHLRTDLPDLRAGDTVRVHQRVREGEKERVSVFEGIVIARKHGSGISGTFTVRRVIDGVGVERIFPLHSPTIQKLEIAGRARVRRAKLYYIRERAAREVRRKMKTIAQEGIVSSATRKVRKGDIEAVEDKSAVEQPQV